MIVNNKILAYICNDLQNDQDYKIDGKNCYYKDKLIGNINEEIIDNNLHIYFQTIKPVEYITVNITIDKNSVTFS